MSDTHPRGSDDMPQEPEEPNGQPGETAKSEASEASEASEEPAESVDPTESSESEQPEKPQKQEQPEQQEESGEPEQPEESSGQQSAGRSRLRRMARGRLTLAVVGLLVGASLGTGVTAWRSAEPSFTERDMCWGSLPPDVVAGLVSGGEIRDQETPLSAPTGSTDDGSTECGLRRFKGDKFDWEVTARVSDLTTEQGWDARQWSREFLSSRMAPLGGEITGMVSSSRAWAALPGSCPSASREGEPPTVVTLSSGPAEPPGEERPDARRYRDALARAVVHLANGVLEKFGCEGRYAEPGKLPAPLPPEPEQDTDLHELCGVPGVRATRQSFGEDWNSLSVRVTPGAKADEPVPGGVRSCDVGTGGYRVDELRLMTVEDQGLARVFDGMIQRPAVRLTGTGSGGFSGDLTVYTVTCQTGEVAFVAQEQDFQDEPAALAVLPAYVKAEAKRLGCGEVNVKVPRLPS